ncbi:MAG: transglycosylase domain-containing protein, partial [Pseudoxanthomonas sp.]
LSQARHMRTWPGWVLATLLFLSLIAVGVPYGFYAYGASAIRVSPAPSPYRAPGAVHQQFLSVESPGVASLPALTPLTVWPAWYRAADPDSSARAQVRLLSLAARMFPPADQGGSSRRHAAELAKAVMISRSWSMQQVVDTILAKSYFGRDAYGLEAAARAYYGLPAAGLNAEQSLALIVLMKGPNYSDPGCNRKRFERRYLHAAALSSMRTDSDAPARALLGLHPVACG